jgi:hypothetical protein
MLNIKINAENNNRISRAYELYNKINKYAKDDFFTISKGKEYIEDYYDLFVNALNKFENKFNRLINKVKEREKEKTENSTSVGMIFRIIKMIFPESNEEEFLETWRNNLTVGKDIATTDILKEMTTAAKSILNANAKLSEQMTKDLEILYAIDESGKESVFVKQ